MTSQPISVDILHTGGYYPAFVEEYLRSQNAPVNSYEISADAFATLDRPEEALPEGLGRGRVVIAIALPPGVLTALPGVLAGTQCGALLVPVEDPNWVRPGLGLQVQRLCREAGLERAVSAPFCSLVPSGEVIREFCEQYRIGRPWFKVSVADGQVTKSACLRGAPCGLTHWLAEQLPGTPAEELVERAQTLHHARPCLASMALVPELRDTLMHVSVNMVKQAIANALRRTEGSSAAQDWP